MLADFLKKFQTQSKSSHLSQALSSGVDAQTSDTSAATSQWAPLLQEHHVTKLKQEAQALLKANGLPFDEQALKEILWEVFQTTSSKLKRNALRPLSVIHDEKGTPYALFRGVLGRGAFGKVKLALNLFL